MTQTFSSLRRRLDRAGIWLSALCAIHCVAGLVLLAGLGAGGSVLLSPEIHRVGLVVAVLVAAVAIGIGAVRHRRRAPFVVAMTGLSFMGGALAVGHGLDEAILTIIGVTLVAGAHVMNLRHAHGALSAPHGQHHP